MLDPQERAPERESMVTDQCAARGIRDPNVLQALARVPRHHFVPANQASSAYWDSALPIGYGQTISQPYIVALMCELARPAPGKKVLEVGTGSGYQAAVLAEAGAQVYTVEIIPYQAQKAKEVLQRLDFLDRIHTREGDGFAGWPEAAPFDAILISCAVREVPGPLMDQLAPDGRLVLPRGENLAYQTLTVVTRGQGQPWQYQDVTGVVFVPMTGPHGFSPEAKNQRSGSAT